MKTALLVLVLLVHTVYSSSSTRVEILELFHSARSSIAKNAHIANMIQLEYQSELENILYVKLGKSGGCSDSKTIYDNYGSRILVEIHLNVNTETMDQQSFSKLFGGADKQVMAHVETKCMETGKEVHSYVFYKTGEQEIHGPPGSQCPRGSRTTSDGLCEQFYKREGNETWFHVTMGAVALIIIISCIIGSCCWLCGGRGRGGKDSKKIESSEENDD